MRSHRVITAAVIGAAFTIGAIAVGIACSRSSGSSSAGGLAQLEQDTGVQWVAVTDPRFGATSYVFPRSTPPITLTPDTQPGTAAMAFFAKYGGHLPDDDPAHELTPRSSGSAQGLQFASFTQTEGAAIVDGGRLTMVFDTTGHIAFVTGLYVSEAPRFLDERCSLACGG